MLVHIRSKEVLYWHEEQHVFVYDCNNKCLSFCQIKDLDLYSNRYGALYNIIESDVCLEPADENKNLCSPKEKYFPPDCVGPRECPYPGVCYRFETEQQDDECSESERES
jgi:hypothetical protein